jgi:hypothetical protein
LQIANGGGVVLLLITAAVAWPLVRNMLTLRRDVADGL